MKLFVKPSSAPGPPLLLVAGSADNIIPAWLDKTNHAR
jgi:hypothetical protein